MSLAKQVKSLCDRLEGFGWRDLLLTITDGQLDIRQKSVKALEAELVKPLDPSRFQRTSSSCRTGFEDFCTSGRQAVTGGSPARSLLYHALASPDVHPTSDYCESKDSDHYPTLDELDTLENYIFSLVANRQDLSGTFVCVFAYQYRPATRSTHRIHADMTYSRTGVARIGTSADNYDSSRRGFWVMPSRGDGVCVLPARYGVFLARFGVSGAFGTVQGGKADDEYIFPVHKLFNGKECLDGKNLKIRFGEYHRNDKIRKTHELSTTAGGLPVPDGFDIHKFPYVRDSENCDDLVSLRPTGSSVLLVPIAHPTFVRTASQKMASGKNALVHFQVPERNDLDDPAARIRGRRTRYAQSTLEIPAFDSPFEVNESERLAPEYVNIRHEVDPAGPANQTPVPIGDANPAEFDSKLAKGGYFAAHFIDDTCDGCISASVDGIKPNSKDRPAYSLVTAPDFYPLADQIELEAFGGISRIQPLSAGVLSGNPHLTLPGNSSVYAFHQRDPFVSAVVGGPAFGNTLPASIPGAPNRAVSFLPDGASNVFAPGWDTSRSRDAIGPYFSSSGLGSPFPEDAKLCAALSSFWPAVAPDSSRTFGNGQQPPHYRPKRVNQLPMLDDELGLHPDHERVRAGEAPYRGWDGEYGPFFATLKGMLVVNFASMERSDYVTNALQKQIRVSLTADVQSEDLIDRRNALNACLRALKSLNVDDPDCLVVVQAIDDWSTAGAGSTEVDGPGFLLEFVNFERVSDQILPAEFVPTELTRKTRKVANEGRMTCQACAAGVAIRIGSGVFQFFVDP